MEYSSGPYKVFKLFNYIIMFLVLIICVFPYLHIMAKAFNDTKDTMLGGITFYPRQFSLENFRQIFETINIPNAALITISRVISGTFIAVFVQFAAGYALTKKGIMGKKLITYLLMMPLFFNAGLIPSYIWYAQIGLLNNFLVYILPGAFSYFNTIIIRTYITSSISVSIEESAKIDGANEVTIFFRIILPLCKPILATIGLFMAVGYWNDWVTTLCFITKKNLFTLQYELMRIIREGDILQAAVAAAYRKGQQVDQTIIKPTPEALMSAQLIITTIPIILVYPFLQKYFIAGMTIGSVKE